MLRFSAQSVQSIIGRLTRLNHRIARNSAEFTLRLSSCRFHKRLCRPNSRQQKALENIMFSRALSGCGEAQPPIPTFADGGYLRGYWPAPCGVSVRGEQRLAVSGHFPVCSARYQGNSQYKIAMNSVPALVQAATL